MDQEIGKLVFIITAQFTNNAQVYSIRKTQIMSSNIFQLKIKQQKKSTNIQQRPSATL